MPKITIDFNQPIIDFAPDAPDAVEGMAPIKDGKGKDLLQSNILALMLKMSATGDVIKHLDWVIDLAGSTKTITVDESDYEYLLKFVKDNKEHQAIARARIVKTMITAKEAAGKKT